MLPLLKSPLVASAAFSAVAAIASCVAPSVHPLAADIATALCSVSLSKGTVPEDLKAGPDQDSDSDAGSEGGEGDGEGGGGRAGNGVGGGRGDGRGAKGGVIERVVTGVSAACKHGGLLPAATYGAIFPVRPLSFDIPKCYTVQIMFQTLCSTAQPYHLRRHLPHETPLLRNPNLLYATRHVV